MNNFMSFKKNIILAFVLYITTVLCYASSQVQFLQDSPGKLTIQQVISRTSEFSQIDSNNLNFGVVDNALWLKVTLDKGEGKQLLEIDSPLLKFINFYIPSVSGGYIIKKTNSDILPNYRTYLFNLEKDKHIAKEYFLKLEGTGNLYFKYFIMDEIDFITHSNNDYLLIGLYLGLIFALVLAGLGRYVITRDIKNLFFVLFMLALGLYFSSVSGVWGQFILDNNHELSHKFVIIFSGLVLLTALLFTRFFLEIREDCSSMNSTIKVLFFIIVLQILLNFFYNSLFIVRVGQFLWIGVPALILFFSIACTINGKKSARFMVLAWGILFLSEMTSASNIAGLMPINFFTVHSISLGSAVAAIILYWAMLDKSHINFEYSFSTHQLKSKTISEKAREMEFRLDDKNKEIEHYKKLIEEKDIEIEYSQKRQKELSTYDGLTKLNNYSNFVVQFQRFLHDAKRYHYPVVIVLIDIDHLDKINESYGMIAGNEVLKGVARIVQEVSRVTDLIGRYGEDEFVFVMTHALLENAEKKGNKILQRIREMKIKSHPCLSITASIGITVLGASEQNIDSHFILEKAEKTIANALDEGGDCVSVFTYDDTHTD